MQIVWDHWLLTSALIPTPGIEGFLRGSEILGLWADYCMSGANPIKAQNDER
jgi:hypothetical protein